MAQVAPAAAVADEEAAVASPEELKAKLSELQEALSKATSLIEMYKITAAAQNIAKQSVTARASSRSRWPRLSRPRRRRTTCC